MREQGRPTRVAPNNDLKAEYEAQRRAEQAGDHVLAARRAWQSGERQKASDALKEAFAINQGDVAAIDLLGDMYLEEGETEKALELFERALKRYPENASFQEKAAVCRLDLAEIESDKILKNVVFDTENKAKLLDRVPAKAVTISLLLSGAGQFYNDEYEKGAAFLIVGLGSCLGWFYPLQDALRNHKFAINESLSSMSGLGSFSFKVCSVIWTIIYLYSAIDAGIVAKRYNQDRRKAMGLEIDSRKANIQKLTTKS